MPYIGSAVLAALAIAVSASPTVAQTTPTHTKVVSFDDLDLTKPNDIAVLKRRVSNAIFEVCRDEQGGDLSIWEEFVSCSRESARTANMRVALAVSLAQQRPAARDTARLAAAN